MPNHRVVWYITKERDQQWQAAVVEVFVAKVAGSLAAVVRVVFRWFL